MEEILNSLPDPMQINSTTLIIAGLFLLLILVLNSFIFKPLVGVLDERQKEIEDGAEARKKSTKTVEESEAAYQAALIEARRKAQARRENLLKESEKARDEIITAAKEKAMGLVKAAATDLDVQVKEAKSSLKKDAHDIANRVVSSVLSRASA